MPKQKSYVLASLCLLTVLTVGTILTTVPLGDLWSVATSWAQEAAGSPKQNLVLPKAVKDYLASHSVAEAQSDAPAGAGDLLTASKEEATELGQVVHHTYGFGQEAYEQQYVTNHYLVITSKTDEVTIKKVVGNRGNCDVGLDVGSALVKGLLGQGQNGDERGHGDGSSSGEDEPIATLKFGQTTKLQIYCSNLIEAEIQTDKGSVTFDWDN